MVIRSFSHGPPQWHRCRSAVVFCQFLACHEHYNQNGRITRISLIALTRFYYFPWDAVWKTMKFLFRLLRGKAFRAEQLRELRVRAAASTVYTAGDQMYI